MMINESHSERVLNTKPFRNDYNLEGVNYPSKTEDWKK